MNSYGYGFITKCAEYGVDPRSLIKSAAPLKREALKIALRGINDPGKRKLARQILNNSKINTQYVNLADIWNKQIAPELQAAGFTDDLIQAMRGNLKGGGVFKDQAHALHNLRNQMKIPTGQSMNTALEFQRAGWGPVGQAPNGATTIGGAAKPTGKVRTPKKPGKGRINNQTGQGPTPNVGPTKQPGPTPNVGPTKQPGPTPTQQGPTSNAGPTPNTGATTQQGQGPKVVPPKSEYDIAIEQIMKTRKVSREEAKAILENGLIRPQDKVNLWLNKQQPGLTRKQQIKRDLIAGGIGLGTGGILGYMGGRPGSQDSVDPNLLIKQAGAGQLIGGAVKVFGKVMGSKVGRYAIKPAIGVGVTYGLNKMLGGGEQDPDAFLKNLNKTNPRGGPFGKLTPRTYYGIMHDPHYGVDQ